MITAALTNHRLRQDATMAAVDGWIGLTVNTYSRVNYARVEMQHVECKTSTKSANDSDAAPR